jgi:hypothetical protein
MDRPTFDDLMRLFLRILLRANPLTDSHYLLTTMPISRGTTDQSLVLKLPACSANERVRAQVEDLGQAEGHERLALDTDAVRQLVLKDAA